MVRGNSGNLRKVPANRRLRASRLAGGPFLFLPISGRFVQLHVRIMVRAAFSIIAESGDPGEQFIGNIVGVMPATDGHAVAHPQAHCKLGNPLDGPFLFTGLAKRLPQAFPRLHAGTPPDSLEFPNHGSLAPDRDQVLLPFLRLGMRSYLAHPYTHYYTNSIVILYRCTVTFRAS